ncbi:hypothetical protein KC347_g247 [Hortaea werneckii]|nr:hypothetical protein KC347_g247 [Hortaea werneckii]
MFWFNSKRTARKAAFLAERAIPLCPPQRDPSFTWRAFWTLPCLFVERGDRNTATRELGKCECNQVTSVVALNADIRHLPKPVKA